MCPEEPRGADFTRRAVLAGLAWGQIPSGLGKGRWLASDRRRTTDPATDTPLMRLTDPAYASLLPGSHLRALARAGTFLVYSGDRGGSWQVFRLELGDGRQQQLTQAAELDPSSPGLLPDDRNFCYFDGRSLRRVSLRSLREREIYRIPEGWQRGEGYSLALDGSHAAVMEERGELGRLRLVRLSSGSAVTVAEGTPALGMPRLRTRREGLLYREGDISVWTVGLDGRNRRKLPLPPGRLGHYAWAPDGQSVFYLHRPVGPGSAIGLRELRLDSGADQVVAETSDFVAFSPNRDASVFVGASGSLAGPYILLLSRAGRRELALCEHRASDPGRTAAVFSADSQRVYFQSDREGKWALYAVPVDRLVERTDTRGL